MAVYERNYGRYQGELTPTRSRFLVLPRYAMKDVFDSRGFVAFFAVCFLMPFAGLLIIYLHHNLSALKFLQIDDPSKLSQILPINAEFFRRGLDSQQWLCFLMALFVGPSLVAPDLRSNGLPLYLSRPFSRTEYVLGKLTVLVGLMSMITWIPGLLLFFFQAYLEGTGWLGENLRIGMAIFVSSWVWILVVSLVVLAISAWVKWKPVARVSLLIVFFVLTGFAQALNHGLETWWGHLLSLSTAMNHLSAYLFDVNVQDGFPPPLWAAWLTLLGGCALSLWLLSRRIRAYEVVR
ncbi:MAG TPA: ABC-2 transporter permease [Solirubrobacterales bacterium]|nr:ABC-2 transporter permease [Solirubrobacterales bacterium]